MDYRFKNKVYDFVKLLMKLSGINDAYKHPPLALKEMNRVFLYMLTGDGKEPDEVTKSHIISFINKQIVDLGGSEYLYEPAAILKCKLQRNEFLLKRARTEISELKNLLFSLRSEYYELKRLKEPKDEPIPDFIERNRFLECENKNLMAMIKILNNKVTLLESATKCYKDIDKFLREAGYHGLKNDTYQKQEDPKTIWNIVEEWKHEKVPFEQIEKLRQPVQKYFGEDELSKALNDIGIKTMMELTDVKNIAAVIRLIRSMRNENRKEYKKLIKVMKNGFLPGRIYFEKSGRIYEYVKKD